MINLSDIATQIIASLVQNIIWILLIIYVTNKITKGIDKLIQNFPSWIRNYEEERLKANGIIKAKKMEGVK